MKMKSAVGKMKSATGKMKVRWGSEKCGGEVKSAAEEGEKHGRKNRQCGKLNVQLLRHRWQLSAPTSQRFLRSFCARLCGLQNRIHLWIVVLLQSTLVAGTVDAPSTLDTVRNVHTTLLVCQDPTVSRAQWRCYILRLPVVDLSCDFRPYRLDPTPSSVLSTLLQWKGWRASVHALTT